MTFDAVGVFGLTFDFLLKICLSILWHSRWHGYIWLIFISNSYLFDIFSKIYFISSFLGTICNIYNHSEWTFQCSKYFFSLFLLPDFHFFFILFQLAKSVAFPNEIFVEFRDHLSCWEEKFKKKMATEFFNRLSLLFFYNTSAVTYIFLPWTKLINNSDW